MSPNATPVCPSLRPTLEAARTLFCICESASLRRFMVGHGVRRRARGALRAKSDRSVDANITPTPDLCPFASVA